MHGIDRKVNNNPGLTQFRHEEDVPADDAVHTLRVRNIQLYKPEDIIKIKSGELGVFSKGNKLFCKLFNEPELEVNRSDNPINGLPSEQVDRILRSINGHINVERLNVALKQEEEGQQGLASHNYNLAFEAITEADQEGLLRYTLTRGYTLQQRQEAEWDIQGERDTGEAGNNQTAIRLSARVTPPQIAPNNHQEKKTENWSCKNLNYDRLDDRLCHYTSAPNITCLDLSVNDLDSKSINLFRKFTNLEALNLGGNKKIDDETVNYLTHFPCLSALILNDTNITSQGIIELFRKAPNIKELSLINIDGLNPEAISSLGNLPKLKKLTLDSSSLTNEKVKAIENWPHRQLQILSLQNTNRKFFSSRITHEGAESLFKAAGLSKLIELDLSNQHIGNKGFKVLMRKNLKILHLSNNGIDDNGLESILHPFPNSAIFLDFSHNSLTDEGMETVLSYMFEKREDGLRRFPHLRGLDLRGNKGIKNKEYLTKVFEEEYRKHNGFLLIMDK